VAAEQVAVMLHRDGTPEAAAARAVGIDRMSLRRALGKRT
jgi:ActR/RegA family two-component response regulator